MLGGVGLDLAFLDSSDCSSDWPQRFSDSSSVGSLSAGPINPLVTLGGIGTLSGRGCGAPASPYFTEKTTLKLSPWVNLDVA